MKRIHELSYEMISAVPADTLRSRATANRRRAVALVAVASVPLGVAIGLLFWWGLGWPAGIIAFVVGTLVVSGVMWWAAEPLARRALGGAPADAREHARLLNLVDALCATVGTGHPDVRVREEPGLNAAVCGRSRRTATLVVTQGLLDELNRIELEECGGAATNSHPVARHAPGNGDRGHAGHRGDLPVASRTGDGHGTAPRSALPGTRPGSSRRSRKWRRRAQRSRAHHERRRSSGLPTRV